MAFLCYVQPLNNGICIPYEYILRLPLSAMPIRILSVNKRLRKGRIQFIAKSSSIYRKIYWRHKTSTRPFGEVGGKFPRQLSSQTHFDFSKIEDKKVIVKN